MTIIHGPNGHASTVKDYGEPSNPQLAAQLSIDPADSAEINASIRQSVQEFPPAQSAGAWFSQVVRGDILPPYGTKARDYTLRITYRNEYNLLIQGTVSAIVKKIATTPWEIRGDKKLNLTLLNTRGQRYSISAQEHYQNVLNNAQFGAGWEAYISRELEDFFTQDFGGVTEIIGPGDAMGPVDGPVMGIAHLDAGRCYVTGNPYWPIMYYSLISGSLHRMHAGRINRFVDQPSPDERFFGNGLCAMSRAIAVSNRQLYSSRYIETRLDDKPTPGIATVQGVTDPQLEKLMAKYRFDQQNDERPFWGQIMWMTSVNVDNPIKVESIPFSQPPEKFDWEKYTSLDVDAIALAFNVDRQELWELAGRGIGSAGQSVVLAEKARGKMSGFLYQSKERFINRRVLPPDFEFGFKQKDEASEQAKATINLNVAQTLQTIAAVTPTPLSPDEARKYLSANSDQFKDAMSNEDGELNPTPKPEAPPVSALPQNASLEDDNPIDVSAQKPGAKPAQPTAAPGQQQKDFVSDDQRRAFFGNLAAGTLSGDGSNAPTQSRDSYISNHSSVKTAQEHVDKTKAKLEQKKQEHLDFALGRTPDGARWNDLGKKRRTAMTDSEKSEDDSLRQKVNKLEGNVKRAQAEHQKAEHALYSAKLGAGHEHDKKYIGWAIPTGHKAFSITAGDFVRPFVSLVHQAVDNRLDQSTFEDELLSLLSSGGTSAYIDGLKEGGVSDGPDADEQAEIQDFLVDQINFISSFSDEAYNGALDHTDVRARAAMWVNKSLTQMFDAGRLAANRNAMYEWNLGRTEKHCVDCKRLNGQRHRLKDWNERGLMPKSDQLDCKGYQCDCSLVRSDGAGYGRF